MSEETKKIEKRLDGVEKRLDGLDQKIDTVNETLTEKFEFLDKKIDTVYETLDKKIDTVYETLDKKIDTVYETLNKKIDTVAFGVTKINLTLENDILPRLIAIGDGYSMLYDAHRSQEEANAKNESEHETFFLRIGKSEKDIGDIRQQLSATSA